MNTRSIISAILVSGALIAAGCGTAGSPSAPAVNSDSGYGVVESVQLIDKKDHALLGTVAGGVVGGLLGHQVGGGRGQTAATTAGAVGGAYAGNQIESRAKGEQNLFKITVRMNDGSYQTVTQETDPGVRVGDRARVENGTVVRD